MGKVLAANMVLEALGPSPDRLLSLPLYMAGRCVELVEKFGQRAGFSQALVKTYTQCYRRFWLYPALCRRLHGKVPDVGCGIGALSALFASDSDGIIRINTGN